MLNLDNVMPNKIERIGTMRERITIQQVSEAQSTSGHAAETWSDLATVWAAVEYRQLPSDEKEMAGRKTAEQVILFTTRYRSDVTEKHRISYASEVYDITSISITPDRFYMTMEGHKRK